MKLLLLALCLAMVAAATAGPVPGPGGMDCSLKMEKKDCRNSKGCLWCEGMFGASCYSKDQAKFLPGGMFKCKPAKKADPVVTDAEPAVADANPGPEPGPTPGPPPMCSDAMEKKLCEDIKGCVWCLGNFGPTPTGTCYEEAHAKWLPKQFYKCSKPKKPEPEPEGVAAA